MFKISTEKVAIDLSKLESAVRLDPSVPQDKKTALLEYIATPSFVDKLKAGALGGGVAYLLGNFLKLKTGTILLLAAAGYGVAKLIEKLMKDDTRYMEYDQQTKMYKFKQ